MTRLILLSTYFLFVGGIGLFKTVASNNWSVVTLIVSLAYLYIGLKLKTLLPKWKRGVQALVAFTVLSNLLLLYLGADVSNEFAETDALGKFLTLLIFLLPAALCGYVIYQIGILSSQLTHSIEPPSSNNP